MRLSVFGLGYVGCVSAACLAARGHTVPGVDANPGKMEFLRSGPSPIVEERIGDLIAEVVSGGRLRCGGPGGGDAGIGLTFVCVGTPSGLGGGLSTEYLERASEQIGEALVEKSGWHVVVYRSTMIPGTCEDLLIPILESTSGKRVGVDFGVCRQPRVPARGHERPRLPRSAQRRWSARAIRPAAISCSRCTRGLPGPSFRIPIPVAEMAKFVDNSFHALKVTFANEIGAICASRRSGLARRHGRLPGRHQAQHLSGLSAPGFAFGGSCLPKDVRASITRPDGTTSTFPYSRTSSRPTRPDPARSSSHSLGDRRIGMLGLSFKAGPTTCARVRSVELAERLLGKGYDIRIFDPTVALSGS